MNRLARCLLPCLLLCFSACRATAPEILAGIQPVKQDFEHLIRTEGQLVPVTRETLSVPTRVAGTLEMLATEGQQVKKGEVVARINARRYQEQMNRFMERGVEERANLMKQRSELPLERLKIQTGVQDKQREQAVQALELELVKEGPRINERVQARIQKEIAVLKSEAYPLDEKEALYSKGFLPEQELLKSRQELLQLETDRDTAGLTLQQQTREYRQPEIRDAELKTQGAGLEYRIADLEGRARQALLRTQTRNQGDRVRNMDRRFGNVQQRLAGTEIKAPFDGTVLYVQNFWGQQPHVGMEIWSGMPVVQVVRPDALRVTTRVDEFQITHVKTGQAVRLTSPSFPDKSFAGQVDKIQRLAKYKDEARPTGLKYFEVEISLPETPVELKANMKVGVQISVQRLEKVWTVPLEALSERGGKTWLRVQLAGQTESRAVEVLARSENLAALKTEFTGQETLLLGAAKK